MNENTEENQKLLLKLPQELSSSNESSLTHSFVFNSLCKTRDIINSLVIQNTNYLQLKHELSNDEIFLLKTADLLKYSRLSDIVQHKTAIDLYISMFEEKDFFTNEQLKKYYKTFKIIRAKVKSFLSNPSYCGNHSLESVKEHFLKQKRNMS